MRLIVTVALVVGALVAAVSGAPPAQAQEVPPGCYWDPVAEKVICVAEDEGGGVGGGGAPDLPGGGGTGEGSGGDDSGGGGGGEANDDWWPSVRWVAEDGGERCIFFVAEKPDDPIAAPYSNSQALALLQGQGLELCEGEEVPAGAAPAFDPAAAAESWWAAQALVAPEPVIAPGEMLVGLDAVLQANTDMTLDLAAPTTPFGALDVDISSELYVDWGDGTVTGPHDHPGEPWPEGAITHVYRYEGAYDVVVTQEWSATWTFGDQSGTLPVTETSGTIDDFPVREVQAVIR